MLRFGGEEILADARTVGLADDDASAAPERPEVVFKVPLKVTDADVLEALGEGSGELQRLMQIKGTDALGWYVTFQQRSAQHGVYLPIEGVATLAVGALRHLAVPLERRVEIASHAILRHELFHFEADCMTANLEMSLGQQVYWWCHEDSIPDFRELEEDLANGYMFRGLRYPSGYLRGTRGGYDALAEFCRNQPAGYEK